MNEVIYIGGIPLSYDGIEEFTNMNKYNNLLNKVAKDFAVLRWIAVDTHIKQPFENRQLYNFCTKALKTYIKFRLELMKNDKVQQVEAKAVEYAVKVGMKYAESKFGIDIPDKSEEYIQTVTLQVANAINQQRIDMFTYGLEWATDALSKGAK